MGDINAWVSGFATPVDYHTEAAGTAITENIQARDGKRLALIGYAVTAAATAHTLSIMYAGGTRTTTSAAAATGQKVINVTDAPKDPAGNAIAANDIVAYQVTGGTWEFNTVASLATLAVTHGTNVAVAVLSGAAYRIFGVVGDGALYAFNIAASAQTSAYGSIYAIAPHKGDPLYVSDNNATNAGSIDHMLFAYINK